MSVHFSRLFDDNFDSVLEPKYRVVRNTLKQTCQDPQIWEVECIDGMVLYIKFKEDGEISCKEKWNGSLICLGTSLLDKGKKINGDRVEFLLEMYSKHQIRFE